MTIPGYEQPWQVRAHVAALKRELLRGDGGRQAAIQQQLEIFEAEAERLKDAPDELELPPEKVNPAAGTRTHIGVAWTRW